MSIDPIVLWIVLALAFVACCAYAYAVRNNDHNEELDRWENDPNYWENRRKERRR